MLKEIVGRETQSSCRRGVEGPSLPMQTCPLHPCRFYPTLFNSVLKEGEKLHLDVPNLMQEDLMLHKLLFSYCILVHGVFI